MTDEFLCALQLVLEDRLLCEPLDLFLDRVVVVCPCVLPRGSRLWVIVPELEHFVAAAVLRVSARVAGDRGTGSC